MKQSNYQPPPPPLSAQLKKVVNQKAHLISIDAYVKARDALRARTVELLRSGYTDQEIHDIIFASVIDQTLAT